MEPSDITRRKTEKLVEAGYQHLQEGNAEAALKVAEELESLRFTATFEIAALAHFQLGDIEAAVAVLKRGVKVAPTVWGNWQLLGNCLSDLGRYDDAASAYENALECGGASMSSIRLNQAILASRRGRHDQALSYVEQVTEPDLAIHAVSVLVTALVGVGKVDEAVGVGEAALRKGAPDDSEEFAYLAASVGRARLARGESAREIVAFAIDALDDYDRSNAGLLALIRDADGQCSAVAKYYRMTVDAKIPVTDPLSQRGEGYVVNYDVVADSVDEALAFVERMETPVVRGNLFVDEHEALEDRPTDPKGVYKRTARHYYDRES
jgi:tetratricopeptide (TPR) repeat protein